MGAVIIVAGVAVGYISAQQALSRAGRQPAVEDSRWTQERVNPKDPYAIYATGHFRAEGMVPPPRGAQLYFRLADDEAKPLRGDCAYKISGPALAARWWSISVAPVGDSAHAVSASAGDVLETGDGRLEIALSRRALPGNWLAMPDATAVKVSLALHEAADKDKKGIATLPSITRLVCE